MRKVPTHSGNARQPRWRVLSDQADKLLAHGRSRAALAPLRKAVELNPALTSGWRRLGHILMAAGEFAAARHAYDRGIGSTIGDVRLRRCAAALAANALETSERGLSDCLAAHPSDPAARHLLGEVLARRNRVADAEQVLRACLAEAPDHYEARASLARLLFAGRRFIDAIDEFDRLLAVDGDDCRALTMKAAALTELSRFSEATGLSADLARRFPDQPYAWLVLAGGLRALGQTAECVAAYRRCLELDPLAAEAWLSLANLKTYRFTAEQLAAMESALAARQTGPADRAKLHFAAGKAREDSADYPSAFEHYARGNALETAGRNYDPDQTSAFAARSRALFTPAFFAARADWGAPAADPIFIVGLPRSGSTLVEQILASHAAVEGLDELPDLPIIASSVKAYPEGLAALTRETCAALGETYLRRTQARRHLGRPHFIDKTPKNFLHIGFIRMTLPRARIVDVRRHPLACGLSVFKQHFGRGFASSFDLSHIGRYYADYVRLMAHFDEVLPGAIHRIHYEDLVADTEGEVRRLLGALELPFDDACLRFFENRRAVDTPSSEQVRQPIFAEGVDHWRRFEPWLEPLRTALGPVLDAYPAAPSGWDKIPRRKRDSG